MRCPNRRCRRVTDRLKCMVNRRGRAKWGCASCIRVLAGFEKPDRNLYTGRKIWSGYAAYGVEKTIQKNHDWIEKVSERAARMRRTAHHSGFTKG